MIKKCYLCGSSEDLERDHIPPECIFKKPLPQNLITVPICHRCHKSYSKDDEYFRAFLAGRAYNNDIGRWIWDNKVVKSTLKRSPALANSFIKTSINVDLNTPQGLYIGKRKAFTFNAVRIIRIIDKICRGLFYYHQLGVDLDDVNIKANLIKPKDTLRDILIQYQRTSIGDDAFIFWRRFDRKDMRNSDWFFMFYTSTLFCVTTRIKGYIIP